MAERVVQISKVGVRDLVAEFRAEFGTEWEQQLMPVGPVMFDVLTAMGVPELEIYNILHRTPAARRASTAHPCGQA